MHVEIDNASYTDALAVFLRACDCTVEVAGPGLLDVEPHALPIDAAIRRPELELNSYLQVWSALQPASAALVGSTPPRATA